MKSPKNILSSVVIATLATVASLHTNAGDLSYIYQQALENDHEYKAAEANYLASRESKNLGRSGLLPKLNASAEISDQTSNSSGTLTNPSSGINNVDTSTDLKNTGYNISIEQPLFNMAAWYDYRAGKAAESAAASELKSAKDALVIRVAQSYFDVILAAKALETAVAEEDAFKHQLEQSRQRFEVGLSAITEVHEAQSVYDSSVARRLNAEGLLGITFEALGVLTGENYDTLAGVKNNFEAVNPVPAERQTWVERALESNATLATFKANAEAADKSAKSASSDHLPTLKISGGYSSGNADSYTQLNDNYDLDNDSQRIALTLNVPIYNGGATSASRRQAKQQAIRAREQYLKTQRDIIQSTRNNHLSVLTSVATVKALNQAIVSTQSALEATQAGYSVGTRNLVDVLNAQRRLYEAKRNYYSAMYDYILNSLRLKQSAGMLSEDDITQLNAWLDLSIPVKKSMMFN